MVSDNAKAILVELSMMIAAAPEEMRVLDDVYVRIPAGMVAALQYVLEDEQAGQANTEESTV